MKSLSLLAVWLLSGWAVTGNAQTSGVKIEGAFHPRCWKVENSTSSICEEGGKYYLNPYIHCGEVTCWTGDKSVGITPVPQRDPEEETILVPPVGCYGKCPPPPMMDVPAIKEERDVEAEIKDICFEGNARVTCKMRSRVTRYAWTCSDKSRILLTDESGGKHCVKFTKENSDGR